MNLDLINLLKSGTSGSQNHVRMPSIDIQSSADDRNHSIPDPDLLLKYDQYCGLERLSPIKGVSNLAGFVATMNRIAEPHKDI